MRPGRAALAAGLLAVATGCGADGVEVAACAPGVDAEVAFTGNPQGWEDGGDVVVLRADGSLDVLTDDGASYQPSFSPDGTSVAFSSAGPDPEGLGGAGPSRFRLFVVGSDGTGRRPLLPDGTSDVEPAWSPDGERIAFTRRGTGIMTVPPGGGAPALLLGPLRNSRAALREPGLPAWSPDGTRLAFALAAGADTSATRVHELWIAGADGSDPALVAEGLPERPLSVAWSPDSDRLAVSLGSAREAPVLLVDPDDGDREQVLAGAATPVAWSPDGGRLFHVGGDAREFELDLRALDVDDDETAVLADPQIGFVYSNYGMDAPRCRPR